MDPNATLAEMLGLAEVIQQEYGDTDGNGVDQDDANRLAELVEALNSWIMKGGFLPKAWREANEGFNHNK
jgi:hypothetical protein